MGSSQPLSFGLPPLQNPMMSWGFGTQFQPAAIPPPTQSGIAITGQGTGGISTNGQSLVPDVTNLTGDTGGGVTPTSWFGEGGKMEGFASIMDGLASLGEVYGALQGVKLGKEQLQFAKSSYATNLANSTQTYNTQLENEINGNYSSREKAAAPSLVDDYLAKHSL